MTAVEKRAAYEEGMNLAPDDDLLSDEEIQTRFEQALETAEAAWNEEAPNVVRYNGADTTSLVAEFDPANPTTESIDLLLFFVSGMAKAAGFLCDVPEE
jgi:hypothetical protein